MISVICRAQLVKPALAPSRILVTVWAVMLAMNALPAAAQTSTAPVSLEVAQQRARFAREQMLEAERIAESAERRDRSAKKRLEQAKAEADEAAKKLEQAQADLASARARHDQAYEALKRAHEALQESIKRQ